jgi:hypothetical protein
MWRVGDLQRLEKGHQPILAAMDGQRLGVTRLPLSFSASHPVSAGCVQPVLLKHVQPDQRIPGGVRLGKRARLAREGIHAVPADAIAALDVDQRWLGRSSPKSDPYPRAQQVAVQVAMLDGLGERDAGRPDG